MLLSSTDLVEETVPFGPRDDVSALIGRAQDGDDAAFTAIFEAFSGRVRGLCRHILRDWDSAEDAASDVFARLRSSILTYDRSVEFERWLLRVAANRCVDVIRRQRLERRWMVEDEHLPEPQSPAASPLTLLLVKERRNEIERAVSSLGEEYRLPLILRYYADLSYEEIAAELDLAKTQVAGRIFRAKHMLRKLLEE